MGVCARNSLNHLELQEGAPRDTAASEDSARRVALQLQLFVAGGISGDPKCVTWGQKYRGRQKTWGLDMFYKNI